MVFNGAGGPLLVILTLPRPVLQPQLRLCYVYARTGVVSDCIARTSAQSRAKCYTICRRITVIYMRTVVENDNNNQVTIAVHGRIYYNKYNIPRVAVVRLRNSMLFSRKIKALPGLETAGRRKRSRRLPLTMVEYILYIT